MCSHLEQPAYGHDEDLLAEPEKDEAAAQVAHAEEIRAYGRRDEEDGQSDPVRVVEHKPLHVVQV